MKKNNQKAKRWQIILLILILLSAGVVKVYSWYWPKMDVEINGKILHVLVARDYKHWTKGLGGKKDLGKYDGMFFVFQETKQQAMVMRDMRFPIDIVWLDHGRVVDIAPNVPIEPGKKEYELTPYLARLPANLVLELPAGTAAKYGIKIDDRLSLVK